VRSDLVLEWNARAEQVRSPVLHNDRTTGSIRQMKVPMLLARIEHK